MVEMVERTQRAARPVRSRWLRPLCPLCLLLCAGLLLSGCAAGRKLRGLAHRGSPGPCPVLLVDTADIPEGPLLRQRVRIRSLAEEREIPLELAVQLRDQVITIVAFTPFGTRAFSIVQRGIEIEIDDFVGSQLGVRPIWLLDALHRSRWITAPTDLQGLEVQRRPRGEERIAQPPAADGEAVTRSFRLEGSSALPSSDDEVSVEYRPAEAGRIRLSNPWCGYTASIESS
jgi:hypothetical protein